MSKALTTLSLLLLALTQLPLISGSALAAGKRPFYILIRPQDLSGPDIYEEYLYINPQYRKKIPQYYTRAFHGDASIFRIHRGVLYSPQTYTNQTTAMSETADWGNMALHAGRFATWEPASLFRGRDRKGAVHIDFGTNAFVQPDDTNDWYFCNDDAGNQLGLSVGNVDKPGINCIAVYAFATEQGP